jgi:hypothetical protein
MNMSHTPTTSEQDLSLHFPAARTNVHGATPIDHGNDMNLPLIGTIALAGAMIVFVIITLTQAWFFHMQEQELVSKSYNTVRPELVQLKQAQLTAIGDTAAPSYRWVDNNNKVVAIPINRAMELTAARYSKAAKQ